MTAQEKLSVMSLSFEHVIFLRETFALQSKMKHFTGIVENGLRGCLHVEEMAPKYPS
jgi:hypothetical protein